MRYRPTVFIAKGLAVARWRNAFSKTGLGKDLWRQFRCALVFEPYRSALTPCADSGTFDDYRRKCMRVADVEPIPALEQLRAPTDDLPCRALYTFPDGDELLPKTTLGWLPFFWRHVLFTGRRQGSTAWE